jgi:hypothetical protein
MAPAQHAPAPAPKKGKGKKAPDPSEQQKQIQAKIAQLELDAAGNKEEELEIGGLPPAIRWMKPSGNMTIGIAHATFMWANAPWS